MRALPVQIARNVTDSRNTNRVWGLTASLAALALSACSDGGGAGDDFTVDAGPSLTPYIGIWDISGNWSGEANDEAFLVIRAVQSDRADALIYDYDGDAPGFGENCYRASLLVGEITPNAFQDAVFLNDVPEFSDAILSLSDDENTLTIQYFDDIDIDGDGDRTEQQTYTAPRQSGLTEADLTPSC